MNINEFANNIAKRWSTVFVANISLAGVLFSIYAIVSSMINDIHLEEYTGDYGLFSILGNIISVFFVLDIFTTPLASVFSYILFIPVVISLIVKSNKIRWLMLAIAIIAIVLMFWPCFPYLNFRQGGGIAIAFVLAAGFPFLILDAIIYFFILTIESIFKIRVPKNTLTESKYFKRIILFSILVYILDFIFILIAW